MNVYEYPNPTAAHNGLIEYGHHQKRLKNIEEGKGKGSAVTQILNSPSEKDIFNVSKYQTEARTFHNKGIREIIRMVERDNRVRKKNEELYYRLESIQKRKMVDFEGEGRKRTGARRWQGSCRTITTRCRRRSKKRSTRKTCNSSSCFCLCSRP
eukprot:TRINITY_DN5956_c0_g1_i2.p1 TRINITY_DN5956_c0_g1~~TRINITY_DN5956_c0_g1_i2.p1  ORF type:complete len:154 (-),score=21.15 TRINITY_DN5956_c0_g1_i2:540-1001(-)